MFSLSTRSLAWQLISRTVGATAVCLTIAFLMLYWSIERVLDAEMDSDMHEDIREFHTVFKQGGDSAVIVEMKQETLADDSQSVFLRLLDEKNQPLYETDLTLWGAVVSDPATVGGLASGQIKPVLEDRNFKLQEAETRIITGQIGPQRILQIGESLESRDDIMEIVIGTLAFVYLLALPLSALLGWLATRRATTGIRAVSTAAGNIQYGKLGSRVVVQNQSNEVQLLADSFNSMAERINSLISDMREMTDNIAHDLRSPLGRIKVIAETALSGRQSSEVYRESAQHCITECDRLIKLINTSLDVAEAEAGVVRMNLSPVDLSSVAFEACELFDPVAEERNIDLVQQIDSSNTMEGDRQTLLRMLINLIDNAIKYSPNDGEVKVSLKSDTTSTILEVADNGIGVPENDRDKVFDRFFRCDQSRTDEGCGLGLSFARAVARLHGGEIQLRSNSNYKTVFRVSFGH